MGLFMTKEEKDFEQILSENLDFQRLGFLELSIHPVNEDEVYFFSEYYRLSETNIPKLGLTIARRKASSDFFINIGSNSFNSLYKFTSNALEISQIIPTLENYLKCVRNGHKYIQEGN